MKGSGFRVGLRVLPPVAVGCVSCSDLSAAHGAGMFEVAAVYLNGEQQATMWSFPKLFVFLGVPIIRMIIFWGLDWGPPFSGNCHAIDFPQGSRFRGAKGTEHLQCTPQILNQPYHGIMGAISHSHNAENLMLQPKP